MRSAQSALDSGRLEEARTAAHLALDQSPGSPGVRALAAEIDRRIETERTSATTQAQVSDLVSEGRRAYRSGKYRTAAGLFNEALALDPQSELASDYLGLAQDRLRQSGRRTTAVSSGGTARQPALELDRTGIPPARVQPGNARIVVYYDSPINAGSITVAVDGETISDIRFDHTKKGFLGIKMEGQGTIKRVILAPSGARSVAVTLTDRKRGVIGSRTFTTTLDKDSEWTIRIDQPKSSVDPSFSLIRTSR
jgi:hypothetical protein